MSRDPVALRALIVRAVLANPVTLFPDDATRARLQDPAADCAFEELGFDSLARMEFCIWMQLETGIEVAEAALLDHPTVGALAAHIAAR